MAIVSITDITNVIVDGTPRGHIIDAVRNVPLAAADLKAAFDVWYIERTAEVAALGTKPEAQAIIRGQAIASLRAEIVADQARLAALEAAPIP